MKAFFKFCLIFWLINQTESQIASCDYKYDYQSNAGFKTSNASYYKCDLDTSQSNYDKKLTRIFGQHAAGHTDADVKWIANYKDTNLKTFSSIFCQKFPNLEVIQINDAGLESIDEDSLSNCQNLDHLSLGRNNIRELPENFLIRHSNLINFWVDFNQLTTLPENIFLNQKKLKQLILNDNQINFLPSNIFRPLVKLELCILAINMLESINPKWFVNLQNLKELALGENQITEIPSKCFKTLHNLEKLWLYDNKIKTLNSDSFDGFQNLQILNLNSNEISDLPVGVFTQLYSLQSFGLHNNKLITINSASFGVHNKLKEIDLGNNNINVVDPKFIDNTAVSYLNMTNNICTQSVSRSKAQAKNNLRHCFANYQPRPVQTPSSCGRSIMPQGNIIGGNKIKLGSYPWIAALMRPNKQFFCGGTLVSNRKVVTAAHCMKDKGHLISLSPNELRVLLGFYNLDIPFETGRVNLSVQSIHINPDWSSLTRSYDADVAVLILDQDVTFNMYIQPICMTSTDPRMTEGIVVGNGKSGEKEIYENIPKNLKMPIQTDEICMNKDSFFKILSSGRTFCAGSADGNGVCSGDSGSGFVVKIGIAYYLLGIVSVSLGDPMLGCDVNSYAVFTDASKFVDWINRIPIINEDRYIFSDK